MNTQATDLEKKSQMSTVRLTPDDSLWALNPPTLLRATLQKLTNEQGLSCIKDLASFDHKELRFLKGVGAEKIKAFRKVHKQAREICSLTGNPIQEKNEKTELAMTFLPDHQLKLLFFAAQVAYGAETFADFLKLDFEELLDVAELPESFQETRLEHLAFEAFQQCSPSTIILEAWRQLTEREQMILQERVFSHPDRVRTLQSLADSLSLTRERIRQLQIQATKKFQSFSSTTLPLLGTWLRHRVGEICRSCTAIELASSFLSDVPEEASDVVLYAWFQAADLTANGGWMYTTNALERKKTLKEDILQGCDEMYGIVPLSVIEEHCDGLFVSNVERDTFLEDVLGLVKTMEHWLPRNSNRTRVLAALTILGEPSTKQELSELSQLPWNIVSRTLPNLPNVCRSGKDHWAYQDWVDETYQGISHSIERLIKKAGGEVPISQILEELPERYNVSEHSVRTYLGTPRFVTNDGLARMADDAEIHATYFGHVEEIDSAVQLSDGSWAARIEILDRYFDGYSAGIPFAIAQANGLAPGDHLHVPVEDTPHYVSLIWRIDSVNRLVDLGRLSPVLASLDISVGDKVLVVPSQDRLRLYYPAHEAPVLDDKQKQTARNEDNRVFDSLLDNLFER